MTEITTSASDLISATQHLTKEEKKQLSYNIIGPPDRVNGLYWMVLGTACVILILCVLRLTGIFVMMMPYQPKEFWDLFPDADKIIGMFTTVLSFVVGLFVPSPVAHEA
jgi:hypothetical protein